MPERRKMEPEDEEIEQPPKCDKCGADEVLPILWGLPTQETFMMYERYKEEHGEPPIWLGGCCWHSQLTLLPT